MSNKVLQVSDLTAGYRDVTVLRELSLTVPEGGFVSVIGPNGAGKSTLLKAVYGLATLRAGTIMLHIDGVARDVTASKPYTLTRLGMNYVPQLANTFSEMSVHENLEIGAVGGRGNDAERIEKTYGAFPMLRERRRQRAGTLSGGYRQMLALARALVAEPRLLLLDEPSAGLAPRVVDELFAKLAEINAMGIALLMVEQNARRALAASRYAYVLDMGRNHLEGASAALLDDENVVDLYLGGHTKSRPIQATSQRS